MAKNKRKQSLRKDTEAKAETKPDPNKIEVNLANAPLVTVRILASLNSNLVSLIGYLKHKDIEDGRHR